MAKQRIHPLANFDGCIGDLVFYQFKGKACVRKAPVRQKEFTPAEKANQFKFARASKFAEAVLKDPVQRARYERAAQETVRSAYNVAVSDFMRAPTVAEIDLSRYTGKAGEFIKVVAEEGKIGAATVKVVIADGANAVIEQGAAVVEIDGMSWWYPAQMDLAPNQALWITVTAADQAGNRTIRKLRHTTGA